MVCPAPSVRIVPTAVERVLIGPDAEPDPDPVVDEPSDPDPDPHAEARAAIASASAGRASRRAVGRRLVLPNGVVGVAVLVI
jgi:hypothetical protein